MQVLEGERIDIGTLMSLGFERGTETNNEQVWYCGRAMIGLSKPNRQKPLVLWVKGLVGYIGNMALTQPDKQNHNHIKLPQSRIRELLKGNKDGRYFAKQLFGY